MKFHHQNGSQSCQGTLDPSGDGCELKYLSAPGDGTTELTSYKAKLKCGQRTQVCGKPLRCECG